MLHFEILSKFYIVILLELNEQFMRLRRSSTTPHLFLVLLIYLNLQSVLKCANIFHGRYISNVNSKEDTEAYDWCPIDIPLYGPSESILKQILMRRTQYFTQPLLQFPEGEHFSMCLIPKNMHTSLNHFFLQLKGIEIKSDDLVEPIYQYYVPSINKNRLINDNQLKRLVIIRDPIERLMSFWISHCYLHSKQESKRCFDCGKDLLCFVKWAYSHAYGLSLNKTHAKVSNNDDHFLPQAWLCGLRALLKRDISVKLIKYKEDKVAKNFYEEIKDFMPAKTFQKEIHDFLKFRKNSLDQSNKYDASESVSDQKLKTCMRRLYAPDYQLFYPLFES